MAGQVGIPDYQMAGQGPHGSHYTECLDRLSICLGRLAGGSGSTSGSARTARRRKLSARPGSFPILYSTSSTGRPRVIADTPGALLERVRKLLAKAEAEGVTPAEAEALTAKAAELMARYGIDRALLAAARPDTDGPANRIIDVDSPWSGVKAHLLGGLASAIRCACVQLPRTGPGASTRIHVFGYASDLERAEILYTSLLIQMAHGLAATEVPA